MPAKGFLTQSQKDNLQKALKESDRSQLTHKILMLLLMNDGKTYQEISEFLGCSYRSVAYWCVHSDPDNLESLKDNRDKGNYHKATNESEILNTDTKLYIDSYTNSKKPKLVNITSSPQTNEHN